MSGNAAFRVGGDEVVLADQRADGLGEAAVHADVSPLVIALELGQVDTVVEERPERAVSEAVVVLVDILRLEVDGGGGDAALLHPVHLAGEGFGGLARPAEPDAAILPKRRQQRDREPADRVTVEADVDQRVGGRLAQALVERFREGGAPGVVEAIEERLAVDVENDSIYLLVTADAERRLAGNLNRWPGTGDPAENWFRTRVVHDGAETEARLFRMELPELRLLVGRDDTERQRLRKLLTDGVLSTSGFAVTLAIIGAWAMRRAIQARLRPAFATAAAIAAGDLSSRVALTGRDDEFDRLSATMNTMLDRIEQLMDGVRGVSDAIAHDLRTPIARARAKLEEALANAGQPATPEGAALRKAVERGIADLDGIAVDVTSAPDRSLAVRD